jgi:DNA-binding NtrC family response regulator
MLKFAERAARYDEPVLITGETGSGKTYLAKLIHDLSPRSAQPAVRVNCAAIPHELFEGEMYGHVKGAFTDAKESRPGLFEAAQKSTIVLDEIGEIPLGAQPKLLATLDDRRVRRLGSTRDIAVDVRIIAATNADIEKRVREKRFRADLYHRLAVLTYAVPPLRRRRRELEGIVEYLLERRSSALPSVEITPEALDVLRAYSWPGNIRELDNVLRRAVVFAEGDRITVEDLPAAVRDRSGGGADGDQHVARSRYARPASQAEERAQIVAALDAEGGNKTRAARRLGMARSSLWAKLKEYGNSVLAEI